MNRLAYFVIVFLGLFFIINLSRSVIDLWRRQERIEEARKVLSLEKKKYEELVLKNEYVQKEEFIERQAREKLLLLKPGEKRVIIDEGLLSAVEGTKSAEPYEDQRPNWQKWWKLFF